MNRTIKGLHRELQALFMRPKAIFFTLLLSASLYAGDSLLSPRYQTVYILGMNNGLDQHLTSRLTSSRALWVVLEPHNADAVLTDSVDDTFWSWLGRTFTPEPGTPATPSATGRGSLFSRDAGFAGRYRGTMFLVDPRRRVVIWSIYVQPRNSAPSELDRAAAHVAVELKKAFGRK